MDLIDLIDGNLMILFVSIGCGIEVTFRLKKSELQFLNFKEFHHLNQLKINN
jgi:hypothetical protein